MEDLETRFHAAYALNKLAQAASTIVNRTRRAIPLLISLPGEDNYAKSAICTIRRLAMHADNRVAAVERGVLKPLAVTARSTDLEIQRETAACVQLGIER